MATHFRGKKCAKSRSGWGFFPCEPERPESFRGKFRSGNSETGLIRPDRFIGSPCSLKEKCVIFPEGGIPGIQPDRLDMRGFGGFCLPQARKRDREQKLVPPFFRLKFRGPSELVGGEDVVLPGIGSGRRVFEQGFAKDAAKPGVIGSPDQSLLGQSGGLRIIALELRVLRAEGEPFRFRIPEKKQGKKNPRPAGADCGDPSGQPL